MWVEKWVPVPIFLAYTTGFENGIQVWTLVFVFDFLESGLEISDFMRKIQQSYAMYLKTNTSPDLKIRGPVFEGRFKVKLIDTDEYLEQCIAYVNFNPLKHEIVDNIDNYKWTSYHQIDRKKIEKYKDLVLDELEI